MTLNTCRICRDLDASRPLLRFGVRHYCHAECGFAKWGDEFLRKIPVHEIGAIPYLCFVDHPERKRIARELCPRLANVLGGL
jgi:hypothetical protein